MISWEQIIDEAIPELKGHLSLERVVTNMTGSAIGIYLVSDILIDEKPFRAVRSAMRRRFDPIKVSLYIRSPALAQDFLSDPEKYKPFILRCLQRHYQSCIPFFKDARFEFNGDVLSLLFENDLAPRYVIEQQVDRYITTLARDVFGCEIHVTCQAVKLRTEQIEEIRERRKHEEEEALKQLILDQKIRASQEKEVKKPNVILGRPIVGEPIDMVDLNEEGNKIIIAGEVVSAETKELRGGEMVLLSFFVTDYTSTIKCKVFLHYHKNNGRRGKNSDEPLPPPTKEEMEAVKQVIDSVSPGKWVIARGDLKMDSFDHALVLMTNDISPRETPQRLDECGEKRIELHMHTNMSEMDGIASASDLIARAAKWGHPAVAITDHGVVQAFPEAFGAAKKNKIKLIPGMEGYLTDTKPVVLRPDDRLLSGDIVVVDFETTGLNSKRHRVMEIGAVRIRNGQIIEELSRFVNPCMPIPPEVSALTHITDSMVRDAETADKEIPRLLEFIGDAPFAAHNAKFDYAFLTEECKRLGIEISLPVIDTLEFARRLYPDMRSHKLGAVCKHLGVSLKNAHRAVHDAHATALCLNRMLSDCAEKDILRLDEINKAIDTGAISESFHITLLAAEQDGITNLNRI
ncbi:MAG: PHP domain-containing protein, partial [Clostridia bacterium]|nr:PHP domain-containing protein [Clostridia bacterium]